MVARDLPPTGSEANNTTRLSQVDKVCCNFSVHKECCCLGTKPQSEQLDKDDLINMLRDVIRETMTSLNL